MSEKSISVEEKRNLLAFLESYYDVPRCRLDNVIKENNLPEDITELDFVNNKTLFNNTEIYGTISDEFYARKEYIRELVHLNMNNPPTFKDGYIEQLELTDEGRMKARENPRIITKRITSKKEYNRLLQKIEDQIEFLEEELENCDIPKNLEDQYSLIFSFIMYCIENGSSADIQNSIRPLKYLSANRSISQNRYKRTYSKIANKLDAVFDQKEEIANKLYVYYTGDLEDIVYQIDKCYENK
jgi:hypothetical protein